MRMYCRHCHEPQEFAWLERRPVTCPVCLRPTPVPTDWLAQNVPAHHWVLTEMDRRMLRSLKISAAE